jgi:DNA gyrase subunit B
MDPSVLAQTTLDPKNRILLKVEVDSNLDTDKTFADLLGKDAAPRFRFIMDHAARAVTEDLDI